MKINEKLRKLYLDNWSKFSHEIKKIENYEKLNHPLLLSTTDEFEEKWSNADVRLMIIGMSTNGWRAKDQHIYQFKTENEIDYLMTLYEDFYFKNGNWTFGQTFWNYFYAFEEILRLKTGKKVEAIWNNIEKISSETREVENLHFNVLSDEIKILQPDIILVMGESYRQLFTKKINADNIKFINLEDWKDIGKGNVFCWYQLEPEHFSHLGQRLKHILITYHPNARGTAGIRLKIYIDKLIELIG